MTNYSIEKRCDIHGYIVYVIMCDGKDYVKTDDKITADDVIDKLYIAEAVINNQKSKKESIKGKDNAN